MANWTALAGASGLAAALEEIQSRRAREGELQRRLTQDRGEWTPAPGGMGGPLGFFDALFGYNRPGEMGFGNQRYQFTPYAPMTEQDVRGLGLTMPETITTLAYEKPLPPDVQGPLELVPEQQTTQDVPLPGFVGRRLDPKLRDLILQEKLKERFERFKLSEQGKLFDRLDTPGSTAVDTGGATFDLPGTGTPTSTPAPTPPVTGVRTSQATPPATTTTAQSGAIPGVENTSPQFIDKLTRIATNLGARPEDLLRVISYETNGSFSPSQPNIGNRSSGTGLIQFLSKTAKGLGTTTEALAAMSPEQQLDYVEKYLAPYKGKIGNLRDLYLAILAPTAIGKPDNHPIYRKDTTPAEYAANAPLDAAGKGYITVGDALGAVMRRTGATQAAQESVPAPGQDLPPGSVKVAGPGAGTPPTSPDTAGTTQPTAGTVPLDDGGPFALTAEGRQRIESNNRRTLANNQRLQALDVERRRVQAGIRAGMPGATDRLNALEASVRALRQENVGFYDDSQKVLGDEQKEWRAKLQKLDERRQRPEELKRETTAQKTAEEEFRLGQSLQDVQKDDASLFRDPRTAEPIDPTQPYRQVLAGQKRKGEGGLPEVRKITKDQQERLEAVESALPRVGRIQQYIDQIYGPGGALARMTSADRAVFTGWFGGTPLSERLREQFAQKYPEVAAATKYINANAEALARAIAGVKGAATEGDVQRARDMVANLSAGLTGTLWPFPKISVSLPDTKAVALRTMNDLVTTLEGTTGTVLRNPGFRYPTLRRYEITDEPPPAAARPAAPALTPPTGLNPAWVQQRLPAMTPAQIREAPPEVIRDVNRPSDIPGLSVEQRKALAARLRQRNEEAVKLRRAS